MNVQKIMPCLWFDDKAEEAARFYISIFKNSKMLEVAHFPEGAPRPAGLVMTCIFELQGQQFMALNGGPEFNFTEAISLVVDCEDQREVDHLWDTLIAGGGEPSMCGWLKDRYGLSWQIVPRALNEMMTDKDPAKARRVTEAMLQMQKLDIAKLQQAYDG
jgi:predicted 3-demethylubiquinone-9 3-methyltransferase (glyoxalase superfamily)